MTPAMQAEPAKPAASPDEPDRVIMRAELCDQLDVCSETVRRWMSNGVLPPPDVNVTARVIGWRRSTLVAAGIGVV